MNRHEWPEKAEVSRWRRRLAVGLLAALGAAAAAKPGRAEKPSELKQQGFVNDFENVIEAGTRARLESVCRDLEEKTGNRMLVVSVVTFGNLPAGEFAEQLRNSWSGPKVRERTLVIAVSGQGKMGLGIGSTLDKVLTDAKLDAALERAKAVEGSYFGQKLVSLTAQLAQDLGATGVASDQPPPVAARRTGLLAQWSGLNRGDKVFVAGTLLGMIVLGVFGVLQFLGLQPPRQAFLGLLLLFPALILYALNGMVAQLGRGIQFWVWMFLAAGVCGGLAGVEARQRTGLRWLEFAIYAVTGAAMAAISVVLFRLHEAQFGP